MYDLVSTENGRLDKVLSTMLPDFSREYLKNLILSSCVRVNNVIETLPSKKIKVGDSFTVEIPIAKKTDILPTKMDIEIIYEDKHLAVINKQAGLMVHPGAGNYSTTLVNALLDRFDGELSGIGGVERPGIVHRIDKNTSGLLVVAKNDITHRSLAKQFAEHTITRAYRALVYGIPKHDSGRIEINIRRHPTVRTKMSTASSGGKEAITNYKNLYSTDTGLSLVECVLETGRTHQIRLHMLHIGNPLVGDITYYKPSKLVLSKFTTVQRLAIENMADRQALHAYLLGFTHPITGKTMRFESTEPQDLKDLYEILNVKIP